MRTVRGSKKKMNFFFYCMIITFHNAPIIMVIIPILEKNCS